MNIECLKLGDVRSCSLSVIGDKYLNGTQRDTFEDRIRVFDYTTVEENEIFNSACEEIRRISIPVSAFGQLRRATYNYLFDVEGINYAKQDAENNETVQEMAMLRFSLCYSRLIELNASGSELELFIKTYASLEKDFYLLRALALFAKTYSTLVEQKLPIELYESFSDVFKDFANNNFDLDNLCSSICHFAVYKRPPDKYRMQVSYDTLAKMFKNLVEVIKEDELNKKAEEALQKRIERKETIAKVALSMAEELGLFVFRIFRGF